MGISVGAVRDWSIYIRHGFFDWINEPYVGQRKELLYEAVEYWFDQYPIGYTDVAVKFGIRSGTLFSAIRRAVAKLPEQLRPKHIHFWDVRTKSASGRFRTAIEKLSDIPADRPLSTAERKALFEDSKMPKHVWLARNLCWKSPLKAAKTNLKKKSCSGSWGSRERL